MITDPCSSCGGEGRRRKHRKLEVNIPAGVEEGSRIRLSGEGAVGPNGSEAGDLYLFVSIIDHPLFERDGTEIFCSVPISIVDASLGGSVEFPRFQVEGQKLRYHQDHKMVINLDSLGKECQL